MHMLIVKNIKLLVVHCSVNKYSKNLNTLNLHKIHLKFDWDGVRYHKIINIFGKYKIGTWILNRTHVRGKNDISLGVCLIGK